LSIERGKAEFQAIVKRLAPKVKVYIGQPNQGRYNVVLDLGGRTSSVAMNEDEFSDLVGEDGISIRANVTMKIKSAIDRLGGSGLASGG
jgi:hypothetical protein